MFKEAPALVVELKVALILRVDRMFDPNPEGERSRTLLSTPRRSRRCSSPAAISDSTDRTVSLFDSANPLTNRGRYMLPSGAEEATRRCAYRFFMSTRSPNGSSAATRRQ
jgi:hypothetical protein